MQKLMIGKPSQANFSDLQKHAKIRIPLGDETSRYKGSMEMISKEKDAIADGVFINHKRRCRPSIR